MRQTSFALLAFQLFLCTFTFCASASAQEKEIVGWLEKVKLSPAGLIIHGKLDSGADYSSLNATNVEEFEKDNEDWVRFRVSNRFGDSATFERPIIRTALIKKHFGKPEKRPVVRLGICVGQHYMEADVNLANRRNFETQMLIGRSFLAGNIVIDPALTFTATPNCSRG
ncbi:MAG: ATP-dependent zinc protease [Bdellovibrionales bacterium]|nr:ATP-dependent zinc protease [Bdellovibrionales bacterium]